jgi:hypothetical protein
VILDGVAVPVKTGLARHAGRDSNPLRAVGTPTALVSTTEAVERTLDVPLPAVPFRIRNALPFSVKSGDPLL